MSWTAVLAMPYREALLTSARFAARMQRRARALAGSH